MKHQITGMTRVTVACQCGTVLRLPDDFVDLSKTIRDDKLLDIHAIHVAARKEAGK